jgi:ATP-binding cassette subfamily B protein
VNTTEKKTERSRFFGIGKLLPWLVPFRKTIFWMIVLGILSSLIDAVYPLFNRYALDHFATGKTLDTLGIFILLYVIVLLLQVIDNFVTTYWCGKVEMGVDRTLRNAAFSHLQTLSFSYFSKYSVGYLHARVMSDTEKIGGLCAWHLMDTVWNGSYLICVLVLMFALDASLTLRILPLIPVAALLIWYFQKKLIDLNRRIREANGKITGDFNEGITGAQTIKSLAVGDTMREHFEKDTEEMRTLSVHAGRTSALFVSTVTMFSMFALAVVLYQGGALTLQGFLRVGTLSAFMSYAVGMMEPIQNIINTISQLIAIQANIERLSDLLKTQSDVTDTREVIDKYGDVFHPKTENFEPLCGDVEFRDVSFRYPDGDEMVLSHFNLKVPRGTNVAIVGETGAGKSTLANLVCRFYEPTDGQILIDGRDVRERSQTWLHTNIGCVLQTPHLFSGSIRENLQYGKTDATDEEIYRALDLVSAGDVVRRMEHGLDSEVGEGGDLLSLGEKQLLSFARALLADPRILILDEATASVDTVTEKKIQDAIRTIIQGRTSFVIAHRLSTVVDADIILVVKDGRITERGTHRELLEKHGYYYELFTRQFEETAADLV